MFQRISSLILLFCLTAALLPHGNAAAANQKPEYFANSDVEAYVEEYLYGMDEEQGNRLYRESREHSGRVYLTEASVLQICSAGQRLFALTRESGQICHLLSGLGDLAMEPGDGDRCGNFQICSGRQPPVLSG